MMRFVLAAAALLSASPALAHAGGAGLTGFFAGLAHPVSGLDHLLAMIAVGLWVAQAGGRTLLVLPVAFPVAMAFGAVVAVVGIGMPAVEFGIAFSVLALGGLIVFAVKLPAWGGASLVALFALLHGYAHGGELPAAADPIAYGLGFILATTALHALGAAVAFGLGTRRGMAAVRVGGAAIALTGVGLISAL